jgi:tetratricopeptide (TPR) repeat protein
MHFPCPGWLVCLFVTTSLQAQMSMADSSASQSRFGSTPSMTAGELQSSLSGHIQSSGTPDLNRLRIQVTAFGGRKIIAETNPNVHGGFEIAAPLNGVYELRVLNSSAGVIHSQSVSLPHTHELIVDLRQGSNSLSSMPSVSLSRLQHKTPKAAVKQFDLALRVSAKGDRYKAIQHLEKALEIDPLYFEAINNLGVQFVRENRHEDASRLFAKAVEIDSTDPITETNLAFTQIMLGRFAEAEESARAAVRADGTSARARFYLAISLLEQSKPRKEVIFHLTKASEHLEPARRLLEDLGNEAKLAK